MDSDGTSFAALFQSSVRINVGPNENVAKLIPAGFEVSILRED